MTVQSESDGCGLLDTVRPNLAIRVESGSVAGSLAADLLGGAGRALLAGETHKPVMQPGQTG
jgi:hypothetical protein